jgi:hypothetical protein
MLTPIQQGYYYTFSSLIAIQLLFELGFTTIITQFVAHEKSKLEWHELSLIGDQNAKSRLSSLLKFSLKWFLALSILLFFALLIIGIIFFTKFNQKTENVNWLMPWVILVFSTALNLIVSFILSFYEGLGKIEIVSKLKFYNVILTSIIFILLIMFKANLFSFAISSFVGTFFVIFLLFFSEAREIISNIFNNKIVNTTISWRKEIFPYQSKIAISWISGYLIFQLFNPVVFSTFGAKIAGQMGLTQAVINGIFAISNSWLVTKVSSFSTYIARKEYKTLNNVFFKTLKQALIVMLIGFSMMFIILDILKITPFKFLTTRFLTFLPTLYLTLSTIVMFVTNALAIYLRCHKQEPFLINSILCAILNLLVIYISIKFRNLNLLLFGFLIVMIIGLIYGIIIFINKRNNWHYV